MNSQIKSALSKAAGKVNSFSPTASTALCMLMSPKPRSLTGHFQVLNLLYLPIFHIGIFSTLRHMVTQNPTCLKQNSLSFPFQANSCPSFPTFQVLRATALQQSSIPQNFLFCSHVILNLLILLFFLSYNS